MTITDYAACGYCGTRLIYPMTVTGGKLPAVNFGPDPAGTMAIQHTATGTWLGRFLARDEQPIIPEKRFGLHKCQKAAA